MSESKISCDTRRCLSPFPQDRELDFGDFTWGEEEENGTRYLYIVLPVPGRARPDAICCRRGAPGGERVWGWDGNEDKPTLTPSIHWVGNWHGHLRAGRLESC